MNRPMIKNFFSEDTTPQMMNKTFLENAELYNYIQALDLYIDELESTLKEAYNKGVEDAIGIIRNFKVSLRNNPTKVPIDLVELIEQLKEQHNG